MGIQNVGGPQIVVVKIGGSILTGVRAYHKAAAFLANRRKALPGERYVAVVSAQKWSTDVLERRARHIVRTPKARTLDLLWSTGELRSVALLTLELEARAVGAVGLNVQETGLQASGENGPSGHVRVEPRALFAALEKYPVVVVPGFFAAQESGAFVSLGRGGSDLTAVLLAVALRASRCELLKDVAGYFEKDPREYRSARHIPDLSFAEALAMADEGCPLVQRQAIVEAARTNLPLVVRTMEDGVDGSIVSSRCLDGNQKARDETVATRV